MLATLFEELGLDDAQESRASAERVLRELPVRGGMNQKYIKRFCDWVAKDHCAGYHAMLASLEPMVTATGYSLREWGMQCDATCASQA